MSGDKITIVCSWDGGDYYPVEYVNRLFSMCRRNTTVPFDFVLFAGPLAQAPGRLRDLNPEIRVEFTGLKFWWGGMRFWQPGWVQTDRALYLDLDIVIVGSLDDIINFPSDHAAMKDYPAAICPVGAEKDVNTSVVIMRSGSRPEVWDAYVKAGRPQWNVNDDKVGVRLIPMGAQGIINDDGVPVDLLPENWCQSYKLHYLLNDGALLPDCRIVVFHGRPKPSDCLNVSFVKEHWL